MINLENYGKHAYGIILYLDKHNEAKKTDLLEVTNNVSTLWRTIDKLQQYGIIKSRNEFHNRRLVFVSLTDKGKEIANRIKNAENSINDISILKIKDGCIAIEDENLDRPLKINIKKGRNGIFRLYCDLDKKYECRHTNYLWTIPEVQAMIQLHAIENILKCRNK